MKTETWVRLAAIGTALLTGLILLYLLFRYLTGILLPFVAAALIASALRPAACKLRARTHMPEKLGGIILILGAVFLLSVVLVGIIAGIYQSAREFFNTILMELDDDGSPLSRFLSLLREDVPLAQSEQFGNLYRMLADMIRHAVSSASSALTGAAGSFLMEFPRLFLGVLVGIIALFYLFFDGTALTAQLRSFFGTTIVERTRWALQHADRVLGMCIRNTLLLFLLTFSELLAGFLLLNVAHAVRCAVLVAVVDLLPVFGVGSVLVPWSIFSFLSGSPGRGIGLLILFGVMYIVRQLAEPRLVGTAVGVHPLFSLAAVYAGFRLFGVIGVFFSPLALLGIKALAESFRCEEISPETGSTEKNRRRKSGV